MPHHILLLGATGRTVRLVIDEAIAQGHHVVALARRPQALTPRAGLTVLAGDPAVGADIQRALAGCSAVVSTLNNNRTSDSPFAKPVSAPGFMAGVMRHVVAAMKAQGVPRLAVLSAAGAGSSFADMPWIFRVLVRKTNLSHTYRDHDEQEQVVMGSGLQWTVARPVGLHDGAPKGRLVSTYGREPKPGMRIARATVARYLVNCLDDPTLVAKAPVLSER
jgi:uncharacterized protein YbjT (DUF2867 family)